MVNSMCMFYIFIFPAEAAANHHKEYRNKEDSQYGSGYHTAHNTCTNRILCTRTCTATYYQW